ncbi:MAG: AgmX/PglI C-terminal domain-containing protein [Myxococcales bacterium]|nr:AgmX/PglI C-terminal domain-containing protein [Myxococcota bacterium]MDW8283940.1 AgmX/PglI C-terminal domain-containing protein [Myxococcales bacterium]
MRSALAILFLCLEVAPSRAVAAGGSAAGAPAARPARAADRVAELLEEARRLEEEALRRLAHDDSRLELLRQAVTVLERAVQLDPAHLEARVALGRALANAELGEASLRRSVAELHRARELDRTRAFDYEVAQVLGIVLSRLGRFAEAVAEYDTALALLPGQPGSPHRLRAQQATLLGNSAEALMALGRLKEAIARYSQAEAIDTTEQAALHTLGLAVAYDRDGQLEKSRDALVRSLTTDPAMKLFNSDSVFFVPPGDRHYYVALTAEAFGEREAAMEAWQQFLRELPQSRYAPRARAHLEALRRTPGLSLQELVRAEVSYGPLLLPPGRPAAGRMRSEEDIERVALERRLELRTCYARALRRNARLRGELDVALVVDRHGAVALAEPMRSRFGDGPTAPDIGGEAQRDLVRCAVDTIRRWRFPPSEAEHDEMALPIRFEVRR